MAYSKPNAGTFGQTKQNISLHINNVFKEDKLHKLEIQNKLRFA